MIQLKDLTRGERLRIHRRRQGVTQEQAAVGYGVPFKHVIQWESGDRDGAPMAPALEKLTPGEACHIARRRAGMTVMQTANALGVSRITLLKMEADRTGTTGDLVAFWTARGWGSDDKPRTKKK